MKKLEGLLSTNFQVIGRGPLTVKFTNSSRNPRAIEVRAKTFNSRRLKLPGHTTGELFVECADLITARQNVGNEVLYQVERNATPAGPRTLNPISEPVETEVKS